jgi:hypothetical protein
MFRTRESPGLDDAIQKSGSRKSGGANSCVVVPAQPVDATLSNNLIQQHFPREPICRAALNQNLARAVFRSIRYL